MSARTRLYRIAVRWDWTYHLYLWVGEMVCLLRGPHPFERITATDILACSRCSQWVFPDGEWRKVAYR